MKISVIIPLTGEETGLKRCLDSLNAQTYKNFEIILISEEKNLPNGKNIKQICYHKAAEILISNLNSDWICMVNGDECVSPFYLEKLLKMCEENQTSASICGVQFADINTSFDAVPVPLMIHYTEVMEVEKFINDCEENNSPAFGADENKLIKKDLIDAEDTIADLIDYGTATIIAHKCEKVAVNLEPLYFYSNINLDEE